MEGGATPGPTAGSTTAAQTDPMTGRQSEPSVRDRAADVGGTARDEAAGVAQEATAQARDLVGEARGQVRQQVDVQKGRVVDLLREISDDLEQMADRSDRSGVASDLVRQAAERARDARRYLEGDANPVDDVRRFARRRPGAFLLGALAAGVLAGRATRGAVTAHRRQATSNGFRAQQATGYGTSAGYEGEYTSWGDPGDRAPTPGYTDPNAGFARSTTGTPSTRGGYTPSTTEYATGSGYTQGAPDYSQGTGTTGYGQTAEYATGNAPQAGYAQPGTYSDPGGTYSEPTGYGEPQEFNRSARPQAAGTAQEIPPAVQEMPQTSTSPGTGYSASPAGIQQSGRPSTATPPPDPTGGTTTQVYPDADPDQPYTGKGPDTGSASRSTVVPTDPENRR
jgi:uncharacterized protein YjbJ (UPF0337 family)